MASAGRGLAAIATAAPRAEQSAVARSRGAQEDLCGRLELLAEEATRSLDDAVEQLAGWLHELGVGPADRVGVMLSNGSYFAFAYHGVLHAGGAVAPMNVLLKQREVAFHMGDSRAEPVTDLRRCRGGAGS